MSTYRFLRERGSGHPEQLSSLSLTIQRGDDAKTGTTFCWARKAMCGQGSS